MASILGCSEKIVITSKNSEQAAKYEIIINSRKMLPF